jgi:prolyl oligopeptidase
MGIQRFVTDDGRYLIISVWRGTDPNNLVFYKDLSIAPTVLVVELIPDFEASYGFVNNDGSRFWFLTNLDAPKGRLMAIDIHQPERDQWQEVHPGRR